MASFFSPEDRKRRAWAEALDIARRLQDCDPTPIGSPPYADDLRERMAYQRIWRAAKEIQAANGVVGSALDGGPPHDDGLRERMAYQAIWRELGKCLPCEGALPLSPAFIYYSLDSGVTWLQPPEATYYESSGPPIEPVYVASAVPAPGGWLVQAMWDTGGGVLASVWNWTSDFGHTYEYVASTYFSSLPTANDFVWSDRMEAFVRLGKVDSGQVNVELWRPGDTELTVSGPYALPLGVTGFNVNNLIAQAYVERGASGPAVVWFSTGQLSEAKFLVADDDTGESWTLVTPQVPEDEDLYLRLVGEDGYEWVDPADPDYEPYGSGFSNYRPRRLVRASSGTYVLFAEDGSDSIGSSLGRHTRVFHGVDLENWSESAFAEDFDGAAFGPRQWNRFQRVLGVVPQGATDAPIYAFAAPFTAYQSDDGVEWTELDIPADTQGALTDASAAGVLLPARLDRSDNGLLYSRDMNFVVADDLSDVTVRALEETMTQPLTAPALNEDLRADDIVGFGDLWVLVPV